jgi:hypothetical protein
MCQKGEGGEEREKASLKKLYLYEPFFFNLTSTRLAADISRERIYSNLHLRDPFLTH